MVVEMSHRDKRREKRGVLLVRGVVFGMGVALGEANPNMGMEVLR